MPARIISEEDRKHALEAIAGGERINDWLKAKGTYKPSSLSEVSSLMPVAMPSPEKQGNPSTDSQQTK